jgi:hypothetical protein
MAQETVVLHNVLAAFGFAHNMTLTHEDDQPAMLQIHIAKKHVTSQWSKHIELADHFT